MNLPEGWLADEVLPAEATEDRSRCEPAGIRTRNQGIKSPLLFR
jgi:hypothetical protein